MSSTFAPEALSTTTRFPPLKTLMQALCVALLLTAALRNSAFPAEESTTTALTIQRKGSVICVETDALSAKIRTEGYVSGIAAGTLLDKKSGAHDLGFGLDIVDFLLEPKWDEPGIPPRLAYLRDPMLHGNLPKRYVELPQICTGAKTINARLFRGDDFVAVKLSFTYTTATYGRERGSLWEQHLVFPRSKRYFFASDRITSANDVGQLILRIDMPGHVKHRNADTFSKIYLSYEGEIPSSDFLENFPPDARHLYHRNDDHIPDRFIRAYKIRGHSSPWLAGMTLNPASVYEAWCHQRGYVCFIQEIGGRRVTKGEAFGAAYIIGFFDSIEEMQHVYDKYRGWDGIEIIPAKAQKHATFRWIRLHPGKQPPSPLSPNSANASDDCNCNPNPHNEKSWARVTEASFLPANQSSGFRLNRNGSEPFLASCARL